MSNGREFQRTDAATGNERAILLITAISTSLQSANVKRRSVGWWVWPMILYGHTDQP